jgi:hypothetical protein
MDPLVKLRLPLFVLSFIMTNPEFSTMLDPRDRLILVGTAEQLEEANRMLLPEKNSL